MDTSRAKVYSDNGTGQDGMGIVLKEVTSYNFSRELECNEEGVTHG